MDNSTLLHSALGLASARRIFSSYCDRRTRSSLSHLRRRTAPHANSPPSFSSPPYATHPPLISTYNETARLPDMFSMTLVHLDSTRTSQGRSYEVLVVDDCSRDSTADLALKLGAQYPQSDVCVVFLEKNIGNGGAVRHGTLHGRGRRLLMLDADGASRFEDTELLWKAMDEMTKGEAAVVVGNHTHLVKTEAVVKGT